MIPPRLEALIATALEKDRDLRHQHASDFEAELKRIRRDLESGSLAAATSRTTIIPPAERKSATTAGDKARAVTLVDLAGRGRAGDHSRWPATTCGRRRRPSVAVTDTTAPATPPRATPPCQCHRAPDRSGGLNPSATDPPAAAARDRRMRRPQRDRRRSHNRSSHPGRRAEPRPQASQPPVTPTPQRTPADPPTPGTVAVPRAISECDVPRRRHR